MRNFDRLADRKVFSAPRLPFFFRFRRVGSILCFALLGFEVAEAAPLTITQVVVTNNQVRVSVPRDASSYFILQRAPTINAQFQGVGSALGDGVQPLLVDANAPKTQGYYRAVGLPVASPGDLDGDGIDDLYELRTAGLNPLNASDADLLDPSSPGDTYLQHYQTLFQPLGIVSSTSPSAGETGVSVTRETVFYFSRPISASSSISTTNLFATYGGRKLLGRVEVSSDRRKASLFYLENLPASARVRVTLDGTGLLDDLGREIDVDANGIAGGIAALDFDTGSITPLGQTAVIGQVFATDPISDGQGGYKNRPLAGVIITVDGAEETLRTTTDASGNFKLQPSPGGRFFVHVDGRNAVGSQWLNGGVYYPFIGKAWTAEPGKTNNLAGGSGQIFLPLIPAGALQAVSPANETRITFTPETLAANTNLAGVEIRVPPNDLFSDSGLRGGKVGIAPVPPDRLPEPLPPGLEFDIVITIQTDGPSNFDRPVAIRFRNNPDPVTGATLAPGAKDALWSFNHDTGRWEIVGPMTVSADGQYVESDPDTGVRQPGWHGRRRRGRNKGDTWEDLGKNLNGVYENGFKTGWNGFNTLVSIGSVPVLGTFLDSINFVNDLDNCIGKIKSGGAGGLVSDDCIKSAVFVAKFYPPTALAANGISILWGAVDTYSSYQAMDASIEDAKDSFAACAADNGLDFGNLPPPTSFPPYNDAKDNLADLQDKTPKAKQATDHIKSLLDRNQTIADKIRSNPPNDPLQNVTPQQLQQLLEDVLDIQSTWADFQSNGGFDAIITAYNNFWYNYQRYVAAITQQRTSAGLRVIGYLAASDDSGGDDGGDAAVAARPAVAYQARMLPIGGLGQRIEVSGGSFDAALAPSTAYFATIYNPVSRAVGYTVFRSADVAQTRQLAPTLLVRDDSPDTDGDGLSDEVEAIYGTDPRKADTDGDGISDGVEIRNGTNPLDGVFPAVGAVAAVGLGGFARDVCVVNNRAILALGDGGMAVVDVSNPGQPTILARLNTPGEGRAVACDRRFVAVADGAAGLTIVDIADPPAAKVRSQLPLGYVSSVAAADGVAFAGLASGEIVPVHLATGTRLDGIFVGNIVYDLGFYGTTLFALTPGELISIKVENDSTLTLLDRVSMPGSVSPATGTRRLAFGEGIAYVSSLIGYGTVEVSDPSSLRILGTTQDTEQRSFKQIIPNGSGKGIAATAENSDGGTPQTLELYDISDPANTLASLNEIATPGRAMAVALHVGKVLVADGPSGLSVLNYLPPDSGTNPPTISLSASFPLNAARVESGSLLSIRADARDDVQVRDVEFYVDGLLLETDTGYPFEIRFRSPELTANKSKFVVQAKATDTAGNVTWTNPLTVGITPDRTPPKATPGQPLASGFGANVTSVRVFFNEEIAPETVNSGSFSLRGSGADGLFGTTDDTLIASSVTYTKGSRVAMLGFSDPLAPGRYQAQLSGAVTDLAGNHLVNPLLFTFQTVTGLDSDGDGMTDAFEIANGLDPNSADQNGNGIPDGIEDFDSDGVINALEMIIGTNPRNPRTFNNIPDAQLDRDGDYLPDYREILVGTDPNNPDTDGDGFNDEVEISAGSNPLVPNATLPGAYVAQPLVNIILEGGVDGNVSGTRIASPDVNMLLLGPQSDGLFASGGYIGTPVVNILLSSSTSTDGLTAGIYVALPTVEMLLQGTATTEDAPAGVVVATPPVTIEIGP